MEIILLWYIIDMFQFLWVYSSFPTCPYTSIQVLTSHFLFIAAALRRFCIVQAMDYSGSVRTMNPAAYTHRIGHDAPWCKSPDVKL